MYTSVVALNVARIGHLYRCRIEPLANHTSAYKLVLVAQSGQGGEETILEDGTGRVAVFLGLQDAQSKAKSLRFSEKQIELPE